MKALQDLTRPPEPQGNEKFVELIHFSRANDWRHSWFRKYLTCFGIFSVKNSRFIKPHPVFHYAYLNLN